VALASLLEQPVPPAMPAFSDWLDVVSPDWPWHLRHLVYLRDVLDRVTSGEIKRLMIFMPPRHYKSETVTVRYVAWRLERDPAMRVIVGAYNQTLAERFSRKARRIAEARIPLSHDRTAVAEWETTLGGGLRAVGVGSGVTGYGATLVVIDDPVKSREEANSPAYREKVKDWYTDDLYTRVEKDGAIILIMTRWHERDLAGEILASPEGAQWTVVSLPAEAEEDDPLGRELGEPLAPELFDKAALEDRKLVLRGSYYALYQQKPRPAEGALLTYRLIDAARRPAPAQFRRIVVAVDPATTSGEGSDETGIIVAGLGVDGEGYVLEDLSGRYSPDTWARKVVGAYHKWSADRVVVEINQGGQMVESTIRTVEPNIAYKGIHAKRGKVARAEPVAALYEQGKAHHTAPFHALEDQLCTWVVGDPSPDRLDALVYALTELMLGNSAWGVIDV
jgi:hypothetical protein